jgi:hypothetical protein
MRRLRRVRQGVCDEPGVAQTASHVKPRM